MALTFFIIYCDCFLWFSQQAHSQSAETSHVTFVVNFVISLPLKAVDIIVITQNNHQHKTLLGNKQWRAVDSIKHCDKRLPLK